MTCLTLSLGVTETAFVRLSFAQDSAKSCLWSVQSETNTIYLLGSLHVLKPDAYPLATAIENAYAASQKIVFETDLAAMADPAVQMKMLTAGLYPEGQSLFQNLSADTRQMLEKKIAELGLPAESFARFKPWFMAVTLGMLELQRMGFNPAYGIDMYFYGKAKQNEKTIGSLEPIDYQLDLLSNMNAQNQNSFLEQTLKDLELVTELAEDMVKFWQAGESDKLFRLLFKSFKDHPQIYDRLLIQRNQKWVTQIQALLQEADTTLVIVGAGHLVGPDSVVALLEKKGYTVNQN
jgi:uncharacterized protein YbaP (TraB family)